METKRHEDSQPVLQRAIEKKRKKRRRKKKGRSGSDKRLLASGWTERENCSGCYDTGLRFESAGKIRRINSAGIPVAAEIRGFPTRDVRDNGFPERESEIPK